MRLKQPSIPSCNDAEKGLLGSMMLAPKVIGEFVEQGSEEQFLNPVHVIIYRSLLGLYQARKPLDLVSVTEALRAEGSLEAAGGDGYVAELFTFVPAASNAPYYAEVMRDKWRARKALEVAESIKNAAMCSDSHDIERVTQDGLIEIAGLYQTRAKTHSMQELVIRAMSRYEEAAKDNNGMLGLTTGIPSFDSLTRGLRAGQMITIAAPTKVGKSSLALNIALHNGLKGVDVGIFSMEMTADELTDRLFSSQGRINSQRLGAKMSDAEVEHLIRTADTLSKTRLHIRDEACMTPLQFAAGARRMVAQYRCQLLIVDYVQLVEPMSREINREQQVAEASRTIKQTAAALQVPIIVLAQVTPTMTGELRSRESRAIENDSNIFALITKTASGGHRLELKYTRSCPAGTVALRFHKEFVLFEEADDEEI